MTATLLPSGAVVDEGDSSAVMISAEATAEQTEGQQAASKVGPMRRTTSWHAGGDVTPSAAAAAAAAAADVEGAEGAGRGRRLLRWEYARFSEMKLLLTYQGPPVSFRCVYGPARLVRVRVRVRVRA